MSGDFSGLSGLGDDFEDMDMGQPEPINRFAFKSGKVRDILDLLGREYVSDSLQHALQGEEEARRFFGDVYDRIDDTDARKEARSLARWIDRTFEQEGKKLAKGDFQSVFDTIAKQTSGKDLTQLTKVLRALTDAKEGATKSVKDSRAKFQEYVQGIAPKIVEELQKRKSLMRELRNDGTLESFVEQIVSNLPSQESANQYVSDDEVQFPEQGITKAAQNYKKNKDKPYAREMYLAELQAMGVDVSSSLEAGVLGPPPQKDKLVMVEGGKQSLLLSRIIGYGLKSYFETQQAKVQKKDTKPDSGLRIAVADKEKFEKAVGLDKGEKQDA